jgi:hypothetical protein
MGTALVFLLVLALCGFIAYIGDLLGRRLGKKRLTVFGLRPKHTAILLTIVTGIVIASTTLGLALLIVPGFSKVVTQGERMLAINFRLTRENEGLQKQNDGLRKDTAEEKKRNDQLSGENKQLDVKNRELQNSNRAIAGQNQALTSTNKTLAASNASLKGQNDKLTAGNKELAVANNELKGQRQGLERNVRSIRQEMTEYQERHYLFRSGEEIVRRPISPNPPLDVVRDQIKNLDFEIRSRAAASIRARGKRIDPDDIVTQLIPQPGVYEPSDRPSLESSLAKRAVRIRNTPILLRAFATRNCIEGRPITFYIDPFANQLVFKQGQEIGRTYVDGRMPRWQIFQELINFLQGKVRGFATKHNMLPGNEGLGEFYVRQLFDTTEEIALRPSVVTVVAVTSTDIHRASPLNIQFQVKPGDF